MTPSRWHWAAIAAFGLAATSGACIGDEATNPVDGSPTTARDLHMFTPDLPSDLREQAMGALERDAFRREARFLDALEPRRSFLATDARESDIEAGRFTRRELYDIGAQLFHLPITRADGLGGRDTPNIGRIQSGRRGGPDARHCSSCHWRGGPAGGGDGADAAYLDGDGNSQSSALARNPIALPGAGFVEILAREMTGELAAERSALLAQAKESGAPARGPLVAKGISFGALTVLPSGDAETSEVVGVDADLVVRPFGWKGSFATIRDAVEDALLVHLGMESDALVGVGDPSRVGPFGGADPDGDVVAHEIREGQITVLTAFIAMQEVPISVPPPDPTMTEAFADGQVRFGTLGCATCHTPSMAVGSPMFTLPSREGGAAIRFDLASEGGEPRIAPSAIDGSLRAFLFSDLKRHDMGPTLAESRADRGVDAAMFVTRPLWGVARSGPYLHDGRAATIESAILLHDGEAKPARDAYAALEDTERAGVRIFLTSLTRAKRLVVQ